MDIFLLHGRLRGGVMRSPSFPLALRTGFLNILLYYLGGLDEGLAAPLVKAPPAAALTGAAGTKLHLLWTTPVLRSPRTLAHLAGAHEEDLSLQHRCQLTRTRGSSPPRPPVRAAGSDWLVRFQGDREQLRSSPGNSANSGSLERWVSDGG